MEQQQPKDDELRKIFIAVQDLSFKEALELIPCVERVLTRVLLNNYKDKLIRSLGGEINTAIKQELS